MQILLKWLVAAILDWTFGLLLKYGKLLVDFFKQKKKDDALNEELKKEEDPEKREEIHDEILNPKP